MWRFLNPVITIQFIVIFESVAVYVKKLKMFSIWLKYQNPYI
jgi:hypothetical protein